jgi:formate dehydrogenase maturation protein FdhE
VAIAPEAALRTLAEQIAPVLQLQSELGARWRMGLDVERARERLRAGLAAYDPLEVIGSAGALLVPYIRATAALERAGLASAAEASDARERNFQVLPLIASWLAGEPPPRERARYTAYRAAAVVATSILRRASADVRRELSLEGWSRPECPCCGGPPDFAAYEGAERQLVCSRCDTVWRTQIMGCLGCGATTEPALCHVKSSELGFALVVCNQCGRYLKEPLGRSIIDPPVERALTAQLDAAAEARGLRL